LPVFPNPGAASNVAEWPYTDISLKQIAAQECAIFPYRGEGPGAASDSGIVSLYAAHGTGLMELLKRQHIRYMSEQGATYRILAWPLLPEHLVIQPGGKQWVDAAGYNGGRWPLLPGTR
jgi:hypothetical protein